MKPTGSSLSRHAGAGELMLLDVHGEESACEIDATDACTEAQESALHVRRLEVPLPGTSLRVTDWRIGRGDKVAVIGRNGVGKTTLTETILGLRGGALVDGSMLGSPLREWWRRPKLRRDLGVQLQRVYFPGRPRISELVGLHRKLYRMTSDRVIDALGIDALSSRLYEHLSRGETQRVDLFLALAHEPAMLFLDEPFTGLDPKFAARFGALIADMRNTTLIMCCHTPGELGMTSHTAWLTSEGIARHERTDALRRELVGEYRLAIHCRTTDGAQRIAGDLRGRASLEASPRIDGVVVTVVSPRQEIELARGLLGHSDVMRVETGQSDLIDLLRHCAEES